MVKKNTAQLALTRIPSTGVIPISTVMKAAELSRIVAGLQYVSESERPFVVRTLPASQQPQIALAVGVTGSGLEEDDAFGWLEVGNLAAIPPAVLSAVLAAKVRRAVLTYFGKLNNPYSLKLGDSPVKRLVFVGRWREGGDWIVLQAEIIET